MIDKLEITFNNKFAKVAFLLFPYLYAVSVFFRMMNNTFWLDDYGWVSNAMRTTRDISFLLTPIAGFFRPVVNVAFVVNFWLSFLNPSGYYWANLILHLINVFLVFQVAYRISEEKQMIAWLASLLFAGTLGNYGEAVIWLSGRTELIATAFYLCTMICYWSFLHSQKWYKYTLTVLFFTMTLLSKESTVSLLPALILLDWIGTKKSLHTMLTFSNLKRYIPFGLLLIAYLRYELGLQQSNYVIYENHYQIGWHFIPNVMEYLALMIVPITPQSTIVQIPPTILSILSIGQQILKLGLLAVWILLLSINSRAFQKFSIVWMILSILPYALFTWKTTTRYLYIPSIGFVIVVASLLSALTNRLKENEQNRKWIRLIAGALVVILGIQWGVVNYVINQWAVLQLQQARTAYETLVELARSLGY